MRSEKFCEKHIAAIIPARGGSKGIPQKNIRLFHGKPLITYSISTALSSDYISDVFVTTDSVEIGEVAETEGAVVLYRDETLSSDAVTLDPVIYDAVLKAESRVSRKYDIIITLQATSPLLDCETLDKAICYFLEKDVDTLISVVNKPHLSWSLTRGRIRPNYKERLNRQQLPPNYIEAGAFMITRRGYVTENSRIGENLSVFPISEDKGIDIDNKNDWLLAESILDRKKVIFRVDGYAELGMGHIYNCITMAFALIEHDILIVIKESSVEGIQKIKETNFPYKIIRDEREIDSIIDEYKPDIWVNDCLNTNSKYIKYLKSKISRVVTIEDLGGGTKYADAVINALYTDGDLKGENVYSGWKYVCLREEFQLVKHREFHENVETVIIMFGGTDPSNYNKLLYDIIKKLSENYEGIVFNFLVGIGYNTEKNGLLSIPEKNIYVYSNVSRVSRYMKEADLAITSQGRTIFELACMGIPAIVFSQNNREALHSFANMGNGFLNLGTSETISEKMIENTLSWLVHTPVIRKNMHELMLKYPLKSGIDNVKRLILGYERI